MARSAASIGLSEVISHFEDLEDPRSTINRLHPLPGVLTISLMAVLAGADGPTGIHKWEKGNNCTGTIVPSTLLTEVQPLDRLPQLLVVEVGQRNPDQLNERRVHAPSESN